MSLTKNELKYYSSLLLKKYRDEENRFIVEGRKIVEDGLNSNFNLEHLFLTNEFAEANRSFFSELNSQKINLSILNNQDFKKISDTKSPQGIAAVFDKTNSNQDDLFNGEMIVCLDNISDPGNVGTIVRNCDWFGIKEIILGEECADIYNSKSIRSSMGSIFHCNIIEDLKLKLLLPKLKSAGYVILCTDLKGKSIFDFNPPPKCVVIFSNEANGPDEDVIKIADEKITIPKYGNAESLNVASASAVILAMLSIKK